MKEARHEHVWRRLFMLPALLLSFSFIPVMYGQNIKIRIEAPETVMPEEQFKLEYIVESDSKVDASVILKNIEGFSILYGPAVSSSEQVFFKNGKRQTIYTVTSSYYLEAGEVAGVYALPKVELKINDKKYKAEAFKIEVKSLEKLTKDIDAFVTTTVSKTRIGLTDTLTLTYTLYTTTEISRILKTGFPYLRNFHAADITPSRQKFKEEKVNGRVYKVVNLKTLILQPQKEGKLEIPEGEIIVQYETSTGKIIRNAWGQEYEETIRTNRRLKLDGVIISAYEWKEI